MLIVRVELHSAITRQITEIARMRIANVGGTVRLGDYTVDTFRGRDARALDRGKVQRTGHVWQHRRQDEHVWNLVAKALAATRYAALSKREDVLLAALEGLVGVAEAYCDTPKDAQLHAALTIAHAAVAAVRPTSGDLTDA